MNRNFKLISLTILCTLLSVQSACPLSWGTTSMTNILSWAHKQTSTALQWAGNNKLAAACIATAVVGMCAFVAKKYMHAKKSESKSIQFGDKIINFDDFSDIVHIKKDQTLFAYNKKTTYSFDKNISQVLFNENNHAKIGNKVVLTQKYSKQALVEVITYAHNQHELDLPIQIKRNSKQLVIDIPNPGMQRRVDLIFYLPMDLQQYPAFSFADKQVYQRTASHSMG